MLKYWTILWRRFYSENGALDRMTNISCAWLKPLKGKSEYIKPFRLHYVQDGISRYWDLVNIYDGVITVIYNKTIDKLVMVRQFRPPLYNAIIRNEIDLTADSEPTEIDLKRFPPEMGIVLELCAGLVDKNKELEQIVSEEVLEECGYMVPAKCFEHVFTYRSGIGVTCSKQHLFYCEVTNEQRISEGGGTDDEVIEVVHLSLSDACKLLRKGGTINCPPATIIGLMWFFANKAETKFK